MQPVMCRWLLCLVCMLWGACAWADSGMLMGGVANRQMPLDVIAAPTAAYSFRRLRTSYVANKAVNIVRASDSATSDIGFTADGGVDTNAIATFCNATTCKLVTLYDQIGSRNLTQATDANRPPITANCLGARHCWQTTAATMQVAAGASFTPTTGVTALSVVANRAAGTAQCMFISANGGSGNRIGGGSAVANRFALAPGFNALANDATWHSAVGNLNISAGASTLTIDGVDTNSTGSGNTTAAAPVIVGAASTTCNGVESMWWDNVALDAATRNYIYVSQRAFWGF